MNKYFLLLTSVFLTQIFTLGQRDSVSAKTTVVPQLEIPRTNAADKITVHEGFSLLYNEKYEQASWVAYELTKEETTKLFDRTDKFSPDPEIKTGTADDNDYKASGYDRGHLAPAADMGWSELSVEESFYYSNMSPQLPAFNRGVWKRLEELVRDWAVENQAIYVVTGPVLTSGLKTIGANEVSVPEYYYKVILDYRQPEIKAIGFLLPNKSSSEPLSSFAVSVDSVEAFTGLDFFPLLPDKEESLLEEKVCESCWIWVSTEPKKETKSEEKAEPIQAVEGVVEQDKKPSTEKRTESIQCSATTKKGVRCKQKTYSPNGKCSQHGGD